MTGRAAESAIRTAIVEANAELERLQMNACSTGNISVRWRDGMLITPSGCWVETLAPDHMVFVRFDGGREGASGGRAPSASSTARRRRPPDLAEAV